MVKPVVWLLSIIVELSKKIKGDPIRIDILEQFKLLKYSFELPEPTSMPSYAKLKELRIIYVFIFIKIGTKEKFY